MSLVLLTQMSVKVGITKFGQKRSFALLMELNQLHTREDLLAKRKEDMSQEDLKNHYDSPCSLKRKVREP